MAFEVVMPRLGWTMESGTLLEWRKKDGEAVEVGDILFAVESDKAIQEVEALEAGILRIPPDAPQPGQQVPVGTLLAYIVQPGERTPGVAEERAEGPSQGEAVTLSDVPSRPAAVDVSGERERGAAGRPAISPRARRLARELGIAWHSLRGTGRGGRIVERDVRRAAAEAVVATGSPRATPVARRAAEALGVDLGRLAATTDGRRITRADVEAAAFSQSATTMPSREGLPTTQMRRVIAERMAASAHSAAAVTLTTMADATELVRLREQLRAASGSGGQPVPSYNDLLLKLTACALQLHPALNASWSDNEITIFRDVHIALAVDTEAGLVTPVIRSVPTKSVRQIAAETLRLVERARARQLTPDEMAGGTFTITNLGMYNIDAFTPIINLPQCAILGVGRIARRPTEWQGELALRYRVTLSLTFDHRVVDGAPAARFLDTIRQYVEVPWLWLIQ